MKGLEINFKVYADTQEEADAASKALQDFVNEHAAEGRAVTAQKLTECVPKWKDNLFVKNQIIKYFK